MLDHLRHRFHTWRAYRQTVFELTGLHPHMLADIGFEGRPNLRDIKACAKEATAALEVRR